MSSQTKTNATQILGLEQQIKQLDVLENQLKGFKGKYDTDLININSRFRDQYDNMKEFKLDIDRFKAEILNMNSKLAR